MSNSNVQALEKISSEVVESQFKIILSSQCIKAQAFLLDKLRKQSEQSKQTCNFISNGNFKLENEIRIAELEIKSSLNSLETIKSANVELKKELLLSKEDKNDLIERVNSGIKKYEELWLTSKKRYDNIPLIKEKSQIKNEEIALEDNINSLEGEIKKLMKAIEIRKNELINLDKKYIINIAEYMTQERPKLLQNVKEKEEEVSNLTKEIKDLQNELEDKNENPFKTSFNKEIDPKVDDSLVEIENSSDNSKTNDSENNESVLLPKLQLQNIDLDILADKLEQIRKADFDKPLIKRADSVTVIQKNNLEYNNMFSSPNFKTTINEDKNKDGCQTTKYTEKKLIYILEDIQLHKKETINIFSNLNPNNFQDVNTIKAEFALNKTQQSKEKIDKLVEEAQNDVMEVDLNEEDSSNIVVPPTQFLDLSQGDLLKGSQKCDEGIVEVTNTQQEECTLKQNSQEQKEMFDTMSVQDLDMNNKAQEEIVSSQLSTCSNNDNSYKKLKEKVFKEHNLALSPQFTYSKNPIIPKVYENSMTSKFFDIRDDTENKTEVVDINRQTMDSDVKEPAENMDVDVKEVQDSSVAGFLFTHGSKGLPELLNVSMTSTCIEDSDEFPHGFDSSLLLSPKANLVMPAEGATNSEVLSQEVPNFLSGFKKVGFSFFGNSSTEKKSDCNNKNLNTDFNFNFGGTEKKSRGFKKVGFSFFGNSSTEKKSDCNNKNLNTDFNFNFGGTEKKSRGGLFNMFH